MKDLAFNIKAATKPFIKTKYNMIKQSVGAPYLVLLMWHLFAWNCILERKNLEALYVVRAMLRLSVLLDKNKNLTVHLLEHQGLINSAM